MGGGVGGGGGEVVEADGEDFAEAVGGHGDAVDGVGLFDGAAVVGDDDELHVGGAFFEGLDEAFDVGFVEGGVDFVEDAEGDGADFEQGEEEGDGGEGALAAGELAEVGDALAGRLGDDVDAGGRRFGVLVFGQVFVGLGLSLGLWGRFVLGEFEAGSAAAEHEREVALEGFIDLVEGGAEAAVD